MYWTLTSATMATLWVALASPLLEKKPSCAGKSATAEQHTAHWNTFHVAVAPTVTCLVRGCGAKFSPGPDSLDAFFCHVKEKHEAESDGGQWRRLKNWARKGIYIAPNPYYWAPTADEPMSPSRPDVVQNLDAEDMKDPFKAAQWIARTSFQHKVLSARPIPVQDSYNGLGRGRGRGTSRGTGARRNHKALKLIPAFETESQEELNPQTILECGSGSESRGRDPARPSTRSDLRTKWPSRPFYSEDCPAG